MNLSNEILEYEDWERYIKLVECDTCQSVHLPYEEVWAKAEDYLSLSTPKKKNSSMEKKILFMFYNYTMMWIARDN